MRRFGKGAAAAFFLWAAALCSPPAGAAATEAVGRLTIPKADRIEARWGVRLDSIRVTAAGYFLDFRYRVVDARKAAPIFDRKTSPVLIDEQTRARLVVPRPPTVGPLRNSNAPQVGRTYAMLFGNSGKVVKAGSKVTVVVGDFKARHVVVEE